MKRTLIQKLAGLFRTSDTAESLLSSFEAEKESLQRQFFEKARTAGIPRGLRWVRCEWLPQRSLLREKSTAEVCLLVGVNVSFEAIEGGDMEFVEAVSLIRDACAVFQKTPAGWTTTGRALFNMNPSEATERLRASYVPFLPNDR